MKDLEKERLLRVLIVDALEVQVVKGFDDTDDDEEMAIGFEWDLKSFDQDFVVL